MNEEVNFFNLTEKIYNNTANEHINYGVYYTLYDSALMTLVRTLDYRQLKNHE